MLQRKPFEIYYFMETEFKDLKKCGFSRTAFLLDGAIHRKKVHFKPPNRYFMYYYRR